MIPPIASNIPAARRSNDPRFHQIEFWFRIAELMHVLRDQLRGNDGPNVRRIEHQESSIRSTPLAFEGVANGLHDLLWSSSRRGMSVGTKVSPRGVSDLQDCDLHRDSLAVQVKSTVLAAIVRCVAS